MQFITAKTRFVRVPPQKARLAAGLIRGLPVEEAILQLSYSQLLGGRLLKKTLDSAIANAETRLNARREKLFVHRVLIDNGPILYRAKGKNRGGKVPIRKRSSHFTIVLRTE